LRQEHEAMLSAEFEKVRLPLARATILGMPEQESVADQSVDTLLPASAIHQQWDAITPTQQTQN
jgi:hypothetical protein